MEGYRKFTIVAMCVAVVGFAPEVRGQQHQHPEAVQSMMPAGCPMNLEGVDIDIEDSNGGVAVTFRTENANLEGLRTRVREAASMLQRMAAMMAGGHDHTGQPRAEDPAASPSDADALHGMMAGMDMMRWPQIDSVTTEDTETGILLRLVPQDASQLPELGRQVRDLAAHVQSGQCMMMQMMGHMHGPMSGDAPETDHDAHAH